MRLRLFLAVSGVRVVRGFSSSFPKMSSPIGKRMRAEDSSLLDPIKGTLICSTLAEVPAGHAVKKIGTHDGKFHCDEALACAMLKFLPEFRDAVIVRSRDPLALAACDVVGTH